MLEVLNNIIDSFERLAVGAWADSSDPKLMIACSDYIALLTPILCVRALLSSQAELTEQATAALGSLRENEEILGLLNTLSMSLASIEDPMDVVSTLSDHRFLAERLAFKVERIFEQGAV